MGTDVELQPYAHQVTGHASLMTTSDQGMILKPVIDSELDFYLTMSPALRPFTPRFYGVSDVTNRRMEDHVIFIANLPAQITNPSHCYVTSTSYKRHHQSCAQYEGLNRDEFKKEGGFAENDWTRDKNLEADVSGIGSNPWAVRVRNNAEKKLDGATKSYILIENVGSRFEAPCIIDLKVGTRLYGDNCSTEKVLRHIEKNKLSTTSSLGLRLSGLQVYNKSRYICRDKFYGRGLSADGFYDTLCMFLRNDKRGEIIDLILIMIKELTKVIRKLDSYRLYGSSLIIMYEGLDYDVTDHQTKYSSLTSSCDHQKITAVRPHVDVRLVDFANSSSCDLSGGGIGHTGPDKGFLFGLKNLTELLKKISKEKS